MASISSGSGKYVVRFRVDGSSRQRTFTTRREAVAYKAQVEQESAQGRSIDPARGRSTYKDWYRAYASSRLSVKPQTLATSKSLYDNHLAKQWDSWTLEGISQAEVQKWIGKLSAGPLSPSSVRAVYKEFASSMKAAVSARYIRDTPCVGINLPVAERDPFIVLDHRDIALLAEAINPRYKALVLFLAYSGLRIGEAAALTWSDVDLKKGTVSVRHTVTEIAGKGLTLSRPKTRAALRTVPLPKTIVEALEAHRKAYRSTWVFTTGSGAQLNPRAFNRRAFETGLKKSNLNCRVHDLRHTAISLWIRAGVDLPRVKAWAGHTDAAFTLNTYAKFFPTDDQGVMERLESNIAESVTSRRVV